MIDLSRCPLTPYAHQVVGVEKLLEHPYFFLTDEMGVAKTAQVIIAAQVLFERGLINRVLVVSPAAVRGVWFDRNLGELKKHLWADIPAVVFEFHAKMQHWDHGDVDPDKPHLQWMISNYEFIRSKPRLNQLKAFCGKKTLLVLDESSAVKWYRAQQTKACMVLRRLCGRVVLLNGTPLTQSPADLYTQGRLLHQNILECKTFLSFRSKYAIIGGFLNKQIVGWRDLEDIQRRFAPYVLRRMLHECVDLPARLPLVVIPVPLTPKLWNLYREMRDELVAWLTSSTVSVAGQAVIKVIRLAQLTSGFLGGIIDADPEDHPIQEDLALEDDRPSFIRRRLTEPVALTPHHEIEHTTRVAAVPVQEVGREKLDVYLARVATLLEENPNLKLLTWCRFRPELARVMRELKEQFPHVTLGAIWGGQSRDRYKMVDGVQVLVKEGERDAAIRLLDPRATPAGPVIVCGTTSTGSMGLNLTAASVVIYLSNDFSLKTRLQSEARTDRPGQVNRVSYTDIIATGPAGQKTIDHVIMKALREKNDMAAWMTSGWLVKQLLEE